MLSIVLSIIAHLGFAAFTCPPSRRIEPCTCDPFTGTIRCQNVLSLESVQAAVSGGRLGQEFFPSLEIIDSAILSLPARAFENIPVKRLTISGTSLRFIHDDAFQGAGESLRMLWLENDRLFDVPTTPLTRLPHLQSLVLSNNLINKVESRAFSGLNRLKNVVLRSNRIDTLERGAFPRHLESLALQDNRLSTLNGTLRHLSRLAWLFLSRNRLTTLSGELDGLSQLSYLSVEFNQIGDLGTSLHQLRHLKTLNLAYNNLEQLGNGLQGLAKLQRLNVSFNSIQRIHHSELAPLASLEKLDLSGNKLRTLSGALRSLHKLSYLNLSHNQLTAIAPRDLQGLASLTQLDLSHNLLTTLERAFNPRSPAPLTSLRVSHNFLTGLHGALKPVAQRLQTLDISSNRITSLAKYDLNKTDGLMVIYLQDNPWNCTSHLEHIFRELSSRVLASSGLEACEYL